MHAIAGPHLSRRTELLALGATAVLALAIVVVPVAYVVALPAACAAMVAAAPPGRRLSSALTMWFPLSLAVVVGAVPIA